MKAILVREFGGPEVLKLEDVTTPRPAAEQVLVRIRAVGVNHTTQKEILEPGAFGKIVLVA